MVVWGLMIMVWGLRIVVWGLRIVVWGLKMGYLQQITLVWGYNPV